MKKAIDETVVSGLTEDANKPDETWQKSIPAQVFLNYFLAISYHIQHTDEVSLAQLPFFREHHARLNEQDAEAIAKLLLNCWSTEYALRATAELGNGDYLRHSLHWTFPQAYYSVHAGMQAFLRTLGVTSTNADYIGRELGRLVVRQAYPKAVGYYAAGSYNEYSIHRLSYGSYKPGLQIPEQEMEAQAQIGQFLRTTRKLKAQAVRRQVQSNSQTALRSAKTGKVLEKWNSSHWQQITWRLGYTTIFDLLGRLRISSSHKEIERFVEAEIDFKLFHESLLTIVSYLNGLHEAYVAKALGLQKYRKVVEALPGHLQGGFVARRLQEKIIPLLGGEKAEEVGTAA